MTKKIYISNFLKPHAEKFAKHYVAQKGVSPESKSYQKAYDAAIQLFCKEYYESTTGIKANPKNKKRNKSKVERQKAKLRQRVAERRLKASKIVLNTSEPVEILLPDYLDNSKPVKPKGGRVSDIDAILNFVGSVARNSYDVEGNVGVRVDWKAVYNDPKLFLVYADLPLHVKSGLFSRLQDMFLSDQELFRFMVSYRNYINDPVDVLGRRRNYVISKVLTRALTITKLNVDGSVLPDEFCGYIEPRGLYEGDEAVWGAFVTISKPIYKNSGKSVLISWVTKDFAVSTAFFDISDDETLDHAVNDIPFTISDSGDYEQLAQRFDVDLDHHNDAIRTILNSVIYITHNSQKLTEEINSFTSSVSAKQTQAKRYTKKPYIFVGRKFQVPRKAPQGAYPVRSHFRWQMCGKGRTELRHVFVPAHTKGGK